MIHAPHAYDGPVSCIGVAASGAVEGEVHSVQVELCMAKMFVHADAAYGLTHSYFGIPEVQSEFVCGNIIM